MSIWTKIRDYTLVTVVAALIWLYAENENVKFAEFDAEIEFVSPDNRELLIKPNRPQQHISLSARCNNAQKDQLKELLRRETLKIPLYEESQTTQVVNLLAKINQLPALVNLGISLTDVSPSKINAYVERIETRTLPIATPTISKIKLTNITLKPTEASIKLPASLAATLSDNAKIEARIDDNAIKQLDTNELRTIKATLFPPAAVRGPNTILSLSEVEVTAKIQTLTREYVIPLISIRLVVPISEAGKYNITLADEADKFLRDVKIVGPVQIVKAIELKKIKVWANIQLNIDDLATAADKQVHSVVPVFQMPKEVGIVEPPAAVKVKITRQHQPS